MDEDRRWVTVGFTWNGLRALGVGAASLDSFPEEFKQGMVARAGRSSATRGANQPDRWVGGLASPDLHAIAILFFARDRAEAASLLPPVRASRTRRAMRGSGGARRSTSTPRHRSATRTTTSVTATGFAADHRGLGRRADARLGRSLEGGRIHPRLPRRRRQRGQPTRAGNPPPKRHLRGLPPIRGARRGVPRFPARARPHAGGAGTHRRQAQGPLAQRGVSARAAAGQGRSCPRGRPAMPQQRLQLQGIGPSLATPCRWGRTCAA